ncbi:pantoate--beta-alanine ligase [Isoptericola variabilis]|uniref:Pantothenate synthetase n=1 Tax=Isoptericola variabilis (strain 225) TaxID=743718 RepID=F6FTY0_ISOV2|nr:pantoate--beta-alanine ligase [Isoptericola variabilis]AEG45351.1 Pantothenate synthetase [Isoptericola variabilis 225]TWH34854.1 pantoate--beta-alanine ligase [Isoptericola variabilis J7]
MTTAETTAAAEDEARPAVVRTRAELRDALGAWALGGPDVTDRRAVVMTMGALHEGHLQLVRRAREEAGPGGQVVVTIFVNPLQFGPGEDLEKYPRDLEGDVAKVASAGADVVFAPTPDVVYPDGDPIVRVSAGRIGEVLEGVFRPGHMDGVLTVVLKLMHLVRPDVALFGEKDAQQLLAVRRMVRDLDLDVEIVGVPTVRDPDGLAMSSRNAYLSDDERHVALALSRALRAGAEEAAAGRGAAAVLATASGILNDAPGVVVDYLALVDPATVDEVPGDHTGPALLLVAARVGTTRLIDNQAVDVAAPTVQDAVPGQEAPRD